MAFYNKPNEIKNDYHRLLWSLDGVPTSLTRGQSILLLSLFWTPFPINHCIDYHFIFISSKVSLITVASVCIIWIMSNLLSPCELLFVPH